MSEPLTPLEEAAIALGEARRSTEYAARQFMRIGAEREALSSIQTDDKGTLCGFANHAKRLVELADSLERYEAGAVRMMSEEGADV